MRIRRIGHPLIDPCLLYIKSIALVPAHPPQFIHRAASTFGSAKSLHEGDEHAGSRQRWSYDQDRNGASHSRDRVQR